MGKSYETNAKKAITDFFREHKDKHFTIEEIYTALYGQGEDISKSTVYRRVTKLLASGEIRRFESAAAQSFVYQYADMHSDCDMHFHLKCTVCGKLVHMDCEKMQDIKEHILKEHSFIIGGEAVINGVCAECGGKTEPK